MNFAFKMMNFVFKMMNFDAYGQEDEQLERVNFVFMDFRK